MVIFVTSIYMYIYMCVCKHICTSIYMNIYAELNTHRSSIISVKHTLK